MVGESQPTAMAAAGVLLSDILGGAVPVRRFTGEMRGLFDSATIDQATSRLFFCVDEGINPDAPEQALAARVVWAPVTRHGSIK